MIKPRTAVPTTYAGKQFRSRLEADAALLLDTLGLRWDYERHSFLLPDGSHFCLDFLIPDRRLWLETRGYKDAKGDRQIVEFSKLVHAGFVGPGAEPGRAPADGAGRLSEMTDFLVIGPDDVTFHECRGHFGTESGPAHLLRCGGCRGYSFFALGGREACRLTDCSGSTRGSDEKWELGFRAGKILIAGTPMAEWIRRLNP